MKKKYYWVIVIIIFLLTCISVYFLYMSKNLQNTYSIQQINNPIKVNLPIDNSYEAIQYSLSLEQVRTELNKPLEGSIAEYNKYDWWVKTYTWTNQNYDKYYGKIIWNVIWFKGPGECKSPHGCGIKFTSEGNIVSNFTCSDDWSCE